MSKKPLECRSKKGHTVGLVDALIYIIRTLAKRNLGSKVVREALEDLTQDPAFATILAAIGKRVTQ